MSKVVFTKHAIDKLKTKEIIKLKIKSAQLVSIVEKPVSQQVLSSGLIRCVGELTKTLSLCIVYKFEGENIKVITFFPSQKGRYENKIL